MAELSIQELLALAEQGDADAKVQLMSMGISY